MERGATSIPSSPMRGSQLCLASKPSQPNNMAVPVTGAKLSEDNLRVGQLNIRKSPTGQADVLRTLTSEGISVVMLTEPSVQFNKLTSIPRECKQFYPREGR